MTSNGNNLLLPNNFQNSILESGQRENMGFPRRYCLVTNILGSKYGFSFLAGSRILKKVMKGVEQSAMIIIMTLWTFYKQPRSINNTQLRT